MFAFESSRFEMIQWEGFFKVIVRSVSADLRAILGRAPEPYDVIVMGESAAPLPLRVSSWSHSDPRARNTLSPCTKVAPSILLKSRQGLSGLVPDLPLSPVR